jgi:hypothetical protein
VKGKVMFGRNAEQADVGVLSLGEAARVGAA